LPSVDHLWHDQLVVQLLTSPEGEEFVGRFKDSLGKLYAEESAKLKSVDLARLEALRQALDIKEMPQAHSSDTRAVVMAFITDCQLSGLRPIAGEMACG